MLISRCNELKYVAHDRVPSLSLLRRELLSIISNAMRSAFHGDLAHAMRDVVSCITYHATSSVS